MHQKFAILRMKWTCGISHEQIAKALGLSKGVISKYAKLAEAAGLDWDKISSTQDYQAEC
jgi:predicted transcriptional regulator